jgi:hypothetical protein
VDEVAKPRGFEDEISRLLGSHLVESRVLAPHLHHFTYLTRFGAGSCLIAVSSDGQKPINAEDASRTKVADKMLLQDSLTFPPPDLINKEGNPLPAIGTTAGT